jgi:hypothetical protein
MSTLCGSGLPMFERLTAVASTFDWLPILRDARRRAQRHRCRGRDGRAGETLV